MLVYLLALVRFITTFHAVSAGQPYGETRMDFGEHYIKYQDIFKAFNTSRKQWLYGSNFNIPQEYKDYQCVHFKKDNMSAAELNFTAYYLKDNKTVSTKLYGKLSKDNGDADETTSKLRDHPNRIKVSATPGSHEEKELRLIYSDNKYCSILRVPSEEAGRGCIVLLTILAVKTGLPNTCNSMYRNLCGTVPTFHKVFNDGCKLVENPPGC
uniref:Putative licpodalin-4 1 n=1 Tax=Amblyomma triste TaxID=251400 RepID=A0A023G9U2_AMBTT